MSGDAPPSSSGASGALSPLRAPPRTPPHNPVTWLVPIVTAASMGRTRHPLQAGCATVLSRAHRLGALLSARRGVA